jgi:hypothetical protein
MKRSRHAADIDPRSRKRVNQPFTWLDLPIEIWAMIFKFIAPDVRGIVRFVCKTWCMAQGPSKRISMKYVCRQGWLSVLVWMQSRGAPLERYVSKNAAMGGHIAMLRWMKNNGHRCNFMTCEGAAKGGQMDTLKWLRANGTPLYSNLCEIAAGQGHLELMKWLMWVADCRGTQYIVEIASSRGHLHILRYLNYSKPGIALTMTSCRNAAYGGHLHILEWMKENGRWNKSMCTYAAKGGQLETLQWLRSNGCPWDRGECMRAASPANEYPWDTYVRVANPEIVEWIDAN